MFLSTTASVPSTASTRSCGLWLDTNTQVMQVDYWVAHLSSGYSGVAVWSYTNDSVYAKTVRLGQSDMGYAHPLLTSAQIQH